jgi:hypothetical protein
LHEPGQIRSPLLYPLSYGRSLLRGYRLVGLMGRTGPRPAETPLERTAWWCVRGGRDGHAAAAVTIPPRDRPPAARDTRVRPSTTRKCALSPRCPSVRTNARPCAPLAGQPPLGGQGTVTGPTRNHPDRGYRPRRTGRPAHRLIGNHSLPRPPRSSNKTKMRVNHSCARESTTISFMSIGGPWKHTYCRPPDNCAQWRR